MTNVQKQKDVYALTGIMEDLFHSHLGMPKEGRENQNNGYVIIREILKAGSGLVEKVSYGDKREVKMRISGIGAFLFPRRDITETDMKFLNKLLKGKNVSYFLVETHEVPDDKQLDVGHGFTYLVKINASDSLQNKFYGHY